MSTLPPQTPPGWYHDSSRGDQVHYWNGHTWLEPFAESLELRASAAAERRRTKNPKLATIGHFAWILAVLGVIVLVISGGNLEAVITGVSLIGVGASLWLNWLAVGAIVDAINKRV